MRRCLALLTFAAAGCASLVGIESTHDDPASPLSTPDSGDTDSPAPPDDDDGSSSVETPAAEDAGMLADVSSIDAPVTMTCAETGLVARWKIDEGAGNVVADCSGNALHGVVTNGTWTSNGADGGALVFKGDGWVGFANPALLRITGAFTLSLWVRVDAGTTSTEYVLGKTSDPAKNGYRLGLLGSSLEMALATPSSSSNFNAVGGSVPLGSWHHLAAVYAPSTASEVWYDGARVGQHTSAPASLVASNAEARIGARFDGQYGLHGAVSDVRVYGRALDAAEISALAKR